MPFAGIEVVRIVVTEVEWNDVPTRILSDLR